MEVIIIENTNFFTIEAEKYWSFPKNYKGDKKTEAKNMILSGDYLGSLKKDGYYYRFVNNSTLPRTALLSRNISKVTGGFSDKIEHVPHIIKTLKVLKDTVLIGEVFFDDVTKTSSDVTTILGCLPQRALNRQAAGKKLSFYIFDIWQYNGESLMNTSFEKRIDILNNKVKPQIKHNPHIICAEYKKGNNLWELLQEGLENNEEGIVITKKDSVPTPGKRPARKTLKIKKEIADPIDVFFTGKYKEATYEYTGQTIESWQYWENTKTSEKIMGDYYNAYLQGETLIPVTKPYYHGWAGSLEMGCWKEDSQAIVSIGYISGLTDKIKAEIVQPNNDLILKPCKVSAMQFTDDNKLRHPVFEGFREDLTYKDCEFGKIFQ